MFTFLVLLLSASLSVRESSKRSKLRVSWSLFADSRESLKIILSQFLFASLCLSGTRVISNYRIISFSHRFFTFTSLVCRRLKVSCYLSFSLLKPPKTLWHKDRSKSDVKSCSCFSLVSASLPKYRNICISYPWDGG